MAKTSIEWTEGSWNPTTGCTKISEGCNNCYAEKLSKRLKLMGNPKYVNGFELTIHPDILNQPFKWKKPQMIFVNSMSDIFHEDIDTSYILKILRRNEWYTSAYISIINKTVEKITGFIKKDNMDFQYLDGCYC